MPLENPKNPKKSLLINSLIIIGCGGTIYALSWLSSTTPARYVTYAMARRDASDRVDGCSKWFEKRLGMNDKNENMREENMLDQATQASVRLPSRRRLIKLGAAGVPVVATLASSPAMAWSCRAPSAWGSNMTGVLTKSQAANPGQKSYVDETWTTTNWATNTARSATGFTAAPWVQLKSIRSNIYFGIPDTVAEADKYKFVTMSTLASNTGMTLPAGVTGTDLAVNVLTSGSDFIKTIVTAQLNYLFPSTANQMNTCIVVRGQNQLPLMASGSYTPAGGGGTWDQTKIVTYLRSNYMAMP